MTQDNTSDYLKILNRLSKYSKEFNDRVVLLTCHELKFTLKGKIEEFTNKKKLLESEFIELHNKLNSVGGNAELNLVCDRCNKFLCDSYNHLSIYKCQSNSCNHEFYMHNDCSNIVLNKAFNCPKCNTSPPQKIVTHSKILEKLFVSLFSEDSLKKYKEINHQILVLNDQINKLTNDYLQLESMYYN